MPRRHVGDYRYRSTHS